MPQNHLTLTRQSLYNLVWSKAMSELAKDFGISDVGLAKRCRAVDVPIPYRGYWARVAAGQTPHKLPLPRYRTRIPATAKESAIPKPPKEILRDGPEPEVRFGQSLTRPESKETSETGNADDFRQRIASLNFSPASSVTETCAIVRRTAHFHKLLSLRVLKLKGGDASGAIVDVDVTHDQLERALLLANRLVCTAEGLGWTLAVPPPSKDEPVLRSRWDQPPAPVKPGPLLALLSVEGERFPFRIEERMRRQSREPTRAELAREKREYGYHAARTEEVATGKLRIIRLETERYWGPSRQTWYDRSASNPLEIQIPSVLHGFHAAALEIKETRAEREREEQRRREAERQRQEVQERRTAHAKLRAMLERQAGAWCRARILRHYVRAARSQAGNRRLMANFRDQSIDFLNWASHYIDQLDPLSPQPPEPEQGPEPRSYPSVDESALNLLLCRVAGFDGLPAEKPFVIPQGADGKSDDAADDS